jgi:hypothetical protein
MNLTFIDLRKKLFIFFLLCSNRRLHTIPRWRGPDIQLKEMFKWGWITPFYLNPHEIKNEFPTAE